jgi:high-affinity iron transporter
MLGSALILLREGLEAALIAAIVFVYVDKLGRRDRFRVIWVGVLSAAVLAGIAGAVLVEVAGSLEGDERRYVFAGIMLSAAGVLTWMVFWMRSQARSMRSNLQTRVDAALLGGSAGALASVVFIGVLREGLETSLFFAAAVGQSSATESIIGGTIGLAGAVALGYAFYRGAAWLDLRRFFLFSGALLLLIAAGLLSRALSELQLTGAIPTFWFPVFNLQHVGVLTTNEWPGQLLRGLFGWDPAPSGEELGLWLAYVLAVGSFYFRGLPALRFSRAVRTAPDLTVGS